MPYICRRQVHFPNLPWTAARGQRSRSQALPPVPLQTTAERQAVNWPAPAMRIKPAACLKNGKHAREHTGSGKLANGAGHDEIGIPRAG